MAKKEPSRYINREIRKIISISNSLLVTIPSSFAKSLDLHKGDFCNLYLTDENTIIMEKQE
ncbi:MAG: hypothetical protein ACFFAS_21140 [Promethearchaeota archaeon]